MSGTLRPDALRARLGASVRTGARPTSLARENILSQEENVKEAKESLRIANVQYQKGMLTNLELMDTEFALTVAETNHLQALSDFLTAKAKYDKAIGED